jgi:hypothetical protein
MRHQDAVKGAEKALKIGLWSAETSLRKGGIEGKEERD